MRLAVLRLWRLGMSSRRVTPVTPGRRDSSLDLQSLPRYPTRPFLRLPKPQACCTGHGPRCAAIRSSSIVHWCSRGRRWAFGCVCGSTVDLAVNASKTSFDDTKDGAPHLPFELLEMVFVHLTKNHKALASCMLVCRAWTPCARTLLYAHLRIGPFKHRHAMRNAARSPSEALHMLSDRLPHVQTVEVSWPCEVAALAQLLRATHRVHRLRIWKTARPGRSDIMLISADGLRRCSKVSVAQHPVFDVTRLHIFARSALYPHELYRHYLDRERPFLDLVNLFGDIDYAFLIAAKR